MAKAPKRKKADTAVEDVAETFGARPSRGLLLAAIALSVASLGGGFFLARLAYEADVEEFEPDYVEEAGGDNIASAEKEGASEASGYEEGGSSQEGFLEFEDIITDIVVNDSDGGLSRSFLKLSVILVYRPDPGAREEIEARQPFMRDLFTTFARSLTEAEVRGAAGLMVVKSELLKRARAASGNSLPQDVLIRDIIIQ